MLAQAPTCLFLPVKPLLLCRKCHWIDQKKRPKENWSTLKEWRHSTRGCHFGQKVDLGEKNTFYSQSVLHHYLSNSQCLDFSNFIWNSHFEVTLLTCQDGWMVRALDSHARDPWFKSHWQQAFLSRKGFQKFFKKWLSIRRITVWITVEVNLCRPLIIM